jgi:hypothetical protein
VLIFLGVTLIVMFMTSFKNQRAVNIIAMKPLMEDDASCPN